MSGEAADHDGEAGGTAESDPDREVADREGAVLAELDQARQRLLEAEPQDVVVNHAIGLYEFAALHLSSSPANLVSAALAIDAFGCLVEGLAGRLGSNEPTLRDALSNIRLAFVQIKASASAAS